MSMSGAERTGLFGGVLLAGALLATAIILLRSDRPAASPVDPEVALGSGTMATGTGGARDNAQPEEPAAPAPDPDDEPGPPTGEAGLHRELARLKDIIAEKDTEILGLQALLDQAGIPYREEMRDPAVVAGEAIEELKRCGPETDADDIETLLRTIVAAGPPAIGEIEKYLELKMDVKFTDTWTVLSGRLLGYPGLRLALIDTLSRIGGIPGESSLLTTLRNNESALEICFLISYLEKVGNVSSVQEVRLAAAKRYLDLEPHRQERLVIRPLLGVLASLTPPEEAANALLCYIRSDRRNPAVAGIGIRLLDGLPEPIAVSALTSLAVDQTLGKKAQDAAEILVMRDGAALDSIPGVLEKCAPAVRGVIYRFLARPVQLKLQEAKGRGVRSGLEALAVLDGLDGSIAARQAIADEWRGKEREANLASQLMSSRNRLGKMAEDAAALRKRLTVE